MDGVDDDRAAASPVPSGTSLLWLTNHMADAETTWVLERFAGRIDGTSDHATTLSDALDRYRAVWTDVDAAIAATPSLDASCPDFDGGPGVDLRWILVHLLEETARHAGHADILPRAAGRHDRPIAAHEIRRAATRT